MLLPAGKQNSYLPVTRASQGPKTPGRNKYFRSQNPKARCNLTAQKMNKCFPNFVLFLLGLLILPEAISRGLWRCNETPGHLHPDVYSSNVHNSQTVEGASVSIER
ncbi:uncharacterized protein [Canis lupus baileyi]|uniref:uncharacterized protein isoform X10 n=1 Tax=Canis lupus baileyi TaxID=143281 RepID=UPI003B96B063